jgi:hypothetical protein
LILFDIVKVTAFFLLNHYVILHCNIECNHFILLDHRLAPVSALGLDAPATSMSFAPGATHLLASLTNGSIAVVNAKLAGSP